MYRFSTRRSSPIDTEVCSRRDEHITIGTDENLQQRRSRRYDGINYRFAGAVHFHPRLRCRYTLSSPGKLRSCSIGVSRSRGRVGIEKNVSEDFYIIFPSELAVISCTVEKKEFCLEWRCSPARSSKYVSFVQVILIVLMAALMTYGPEANANLLKNDTDGHGRKHVKTPDPGPDPLRIYPMYQDVHVMIWIGFGFLMTFLRRYGQSAIGLTFLLAAVLVQVAIICEGVLHIEKDSKAYLSLQSLMSADVAVATPLISMGAMLGKTTYMQLVFMGIVELIMFTVNKYVGEHLLMAVDAGDSMFVHAFGAYFGLAVSFVFGMKDKPKEHHLEGASYNSDIFAMIGTVFLWLFWPSFNSAALKGDDQQRAIINTLLSILASCVIAFATSALVSKDSKFNMVHVQNSTLAGGVAIGTAAGMMCQPVGALLIGTLAGLLSVLGYKYLTPLIQKRLRIHDTCGVHNLHGMPGILGGIYGALMAGLATEDSYDYSLYEIFPARAPSSEAKLAEMRDNYGISAGLNRTAGQQAAYQLLVLAITLGIAIVSGLITGLMMRLSICGSISEEQKFDDEAHWELEEESSQEKSKDGNSCGGDQLPMGHM